MYRKLLLLASLFIITSTLPAQVFRLGVPNLEDYDMNPFHFGFSLGMDIVDVNLKTKTNYKNLINIPEMDPHFELLEIYSVPRYAFHVGIVANMRIGKYFDLRFIPSFSFAHEIELYYKFNKVISTLEKGTSKEKNPLLRTIRGELINFPLFIKFKSSRMHNVRFYVNAGGQASVIMKKRENEISLESGDIKDSFDKNILVNIPIPILKPYDVQAIGGIGFEFYTTYFKFSTEFKVAFGVINMLEDEKIIQKKTNGGEYLNSVTLSGIKSMKSKTFTISFIIE